MAYATTIVEVGPEAPAFLAEKMAITFAGNAPEALRPYCFLIEEATLDGHLDVGQKVLIGDQIWTISAVGSIAETNLGNLGHATLVFDGEDSPRMDGAVHLTGVDEYPALTLGAKVVFNCG